MKPRFPFLSAGIFGATGVILGALGTHQLEPVLLERGMLHAWETATRHNLVHAATLFGAAVWLREARGSAARCALWAARSWSIGIAFFSGSLYLLALGGPRWLGPFTPLGGIALLAGWCCVIAAAFAKEA